MQIVKKIIDDLKNIINYIHMFNTTLFF